MDELQELKKRVENGSGISLESYKRKMSKNKLVQWLQEDWLMKLGAVL